MFRFDFLKVDTFLRGRWVGIYLYGGDKITVPVDIPKQDQFQGLSGYELASLYVLLAMVSVGRGSSVDGWPRWAMSASADDDSKLFKAIQSEVRNRLGLESQGLELPTVNRGRLVFPHGVYPVERVCNDDGTLKRELWLRPSPSRPS